MSVRNQPSYSPDLKAPPVGKPNKTNPESPIDMLPKDQPLPAAFKLQVEVDQRQQMKATQGHDYMNVDQLSQKLKSTYVSDPKKLEKLEKFDKENLPNLSGVGQMAPACQFRHGQPLENTETISDSEKSSLGDESFQYELASDPDKLRLMKEEEKMRKESQQLPTATHCYENTANTGVESSSKEKLSTEGSQNHELQNGIDLTKEFDEITDKALKGYGSMMGIFDTFHDRVVDEHLTNVIDVIDDDEEFDIQFDFEADSESSTITESINNDFDLNSADFNEDALFVSEGNVPYTNIPEKLSNENVGPSLEEHQKKLAMYQGMKRNDSEELHERSAQPDDFGQGHHGQMRQGNGFEYSRAANNEDYENTFAIVNGQHDGSIQTSEGSNDHAPVYANVNSDSRSNGGGRVLNVLEFLQRREPSEGHCDEYV